MDFKAIRYEVADGVARVVLNRPDKRNAQNETMIMELARAFEQAGADQAVRVLVLAGAGNSFSAGHDMNIEGEGVLYRAPDAEGRWDYERRTYYDVCLQLRELRMPTIAQVQGHCLAAGLMLANMCDLIVASEDALFGDPVCRMAGASVEVLVHPWVMGPRKAKEILFTGDPITAAEALQLGMVNRVVGREKLEEETSRLAARIAQMPPFALKMVKHSINRTMDFAGFLHALNHHFAIHELGHASAEMEKLLYEARRHKGLTQFLADRDKPFQT